MDKWVLYIRFGLNFFEVLACVAGFAHWGKIKNTYWKWFPVYLLVIVITEFTGKYIGLVLQDRRLNADLYRFFGIPIQFFFFYWLFYQYFRNSRQRSWPIIGAVVYIISWITGYIYLDSIELWFQSFSYTVGNIVLLVLIMSFFITFSKGDDILQYKSSMMFWVSMGLLIFYLGSLPLFGLWNTVSVQYPKLFNIYWITQMVLDYLMYVFFVVAFVWGKPK